MNSVDDDKWQEIWINVYNGTKLSKLTWYSIAGNHDWFVHQYVLQTISRFINNEHPSLLGIKM